MTEHLARQLHHIARSLEFHLGRAVRHGDHFRMDTVDVSALQALWPRIDAVAQEIMAGPTPAAIAAAQKAQLDADQAAVDAAAAAGATSVTGLENAETPPAPPAALSVSPTSISGPVGTPITGSFSISGGVPPYAVSASGLPADMTLDAAGNYAIAGATAETATVTLDVSDSSTPTPLTASVDVPVSIQ